MGTELAASFAAGMRPDDKLFVCDPVYFGGTVDRSIGSEALVAAIVAGGADAVHMTTRAACGAAMLDEAKTGDRIRSKERRVGKEVVSKCKSLWLPDLDKKKHPQQEILAIKTTRLTHTKYYTA